MIKLARTVFLMSTKKSNKNSKKNYPTHWIRCVMYYRKLYDKNKQIYR